jgi:hypothetical protein
MDIFPYIPGVIALLLSLTLLIVDIRRYYLRLRMKVQAVMVAWHGDNSSLVLFRLTFVNPASRGKTVNVVAINKPFGIVARGFPYIYEKGLQSVICPLPNGEKGLLLPTDEVLQHALDIPPHQSRSKWLGMHILWEESSHSELESFPIEFLFCAVDVDNKPMAKDSVRLTLHQLENPDIYILKPAVLIRA